MKKLFKKLFEIGAVKFGWFKYKVGEGPIYIDLRDIISYPGILKAIALLMNEKSMKINFNKLLGIAYAGIPLVTAMNQMSDVPASYIRKEKKEHGTKKLIEGMLNLEDRVLIVDDVITTGESKIEAVKKIREEVGCKIAGVLVFIDREQGGREKLEKHGLKLYSVTTLFNLVNEIYKQGLINNEKYTEVINYLKPKSF